MMKLLQYTLLSVLLMTTACGYSFRGDIWSAANTSESVDKDTPDETPESEEAVPPDTTDYYPPIPGNNGGLSVTPAVNYAKISWVQSNDNVTPQNEITYTVYKSTTPVLNKISDIQKYGTVVITGKAITDTAAVTLTPGTTYYFNVITTDKAGNPSAYKQTSIKTKKFDWGFDGSVNTFTSSGDNLYIGGAFTKMIKSEPYGKIFGTNDETTPSNVTNPIISGGVVNYSCPDGSGGWYIAGDFTAVYGIERIRAARINSDGSLHPWKVTVDGSVKSIAVADNAVYLGGLFNFVNGQPRANTAAVDITGNLLAWNPGTNGEVKAVAYYNGTVFIGGAFTTVAGIPRNYLASVEASGAASAWNPAPVSTVSSLCIDGSILYVGGSFSNISAVSRNNIAAYNLPGMTLTPCSPPLPLGDVASLCVYGNSIYAAAGTTVRAIDINTGTNSAGWTVPVLNANCGTISVKDGNVFIGGLFTTVNVTTRNFMAVLKPDGTLNASNPGADAQVNTMSFSGNNIFIGGAFNYAGGLRRSRIAKMSMSTGQPLDWAGSPNSTVSSLITVNGNVYAGGIFSSANAAVRMYLAAFDSGGNLLPWNPVPNGQVNSLQHYNGVIYAGGIFTTVNAASRTNLAGIYLADGLLSVPWAGSPDDDVFSLALTGSNLVVGGNFTAVGAYTKSCIGMVKTATGVPSSWTPLGIGAVSALSVYGSSVFAGGLGFINSIDSMGSISYTISTTGTVNCLANNGTSLYAGGTFNAVQGVPRNNIAKLNIADASITQWTPVIDNVVSTVYINGDSIFIGGAFSTVNGQQKNRFAVLNSETAELE